MSSELIQETLKEITPPNSEGEKSFGSFDEPEMNLKSPEQSDEDEFGDFEEAKEQIVIEQPKTLKCDNEGRPIERLSIVSV